MRRKTTTYFLEVDTTPAEEAVVDTTVIMAGLEKEVRRVGDEISKSFDKASGKADRFNGSLSSAMKQLRTSVQDMKTAFSEAAEPLGIVLIPALDQAVGRVTDLARNVGAVLSALLGTDAATKKVKEATKAEQELNKASASTASAVKRSLAGFDQIDRLEGASSRGSAGSTAGSGASNALTEAVPDTLSPQLQAVVDKILGLIEPVRTIDLTPLKESLAGLGAALSGLGSIITQSLEWAWFQILVPLGKWVIEEAGPAAVNTLTAAFELLSAALAPVLQGIRDLKTYLEPVVQFIGETVILTLETLSLQFQKVAQVFGEKGVKIQETFRLIGQTLSVVWETMRPILELMRNIWVSVLDIVGSKISTTVGTVIDVFYGLLTFINGVLTGNWSQAWEGLQLIFVGFVNGIIGSVNGLIRGVADGINAIIRALNQVRFTLPDWDVLGSLAGKSYGLNLKTVTAPQIPYLAKGAVLPANRPFLAMVGDQKHGTNVEAPLATIQEAVALVMDDMIASNTAGQEMIIGVLRELLDAVLGIQVGDEVIGKAVQRYNRKMAVVKGGYV